MKNSTIAIAVIILLFFACQDTGENSTKKIQTNSFKDVGDRIQATVAERWIGNFKNSQSSQGRDGYPTYRISAAELTGVLESVPDFIGVAFHHAIDTAGIKHIVVMPVKTFDIWTPIPGRMFVDANTSLKVQENEAQSLAKNYENAHPQGVWFHFFGSNIFDEIKAHPQFDGIDIDPALNDQGVPQLILVVGRTAEGTGGRTKGDPAYYDVSNQCPPCQ